MSNYVAALNLDVDAIVARAVALFAPVMHSLWLCGSYAHGTARPESDLDLLMVLPALADGTPDVDQEQRIANALHQVGLDLFFLRPGAALARHQWGAVTIGGTPWLPPWASRDAEFFDDLMSRSRCLFHRDDARLIGRPLTEDPVLAPIVAARRRTLTPLSQYSGGWDGFVRQNAAVVADLQAIALDGDAHARPRPRRRTRRPRGVRLNRRHP